MSALPYPTRKAAPISPGEETLPTSSPHVFSDSKSDSDEMEVLPGLIKNVKLVRPGDTPSPAGSASYVLFRTSKRFEFETETVEEKQKLSNFLGQYCNLAAEYDETPDEKQYQNNPGMLNFSLGEKVTSLCTPVMINMIFRFSPNPSLDPESGFYNEDFLRALCHYTQRTMAEKLALSETMTELVACVLESKPWHRADGSFVRIRLHFPWAQVNTEYQRRVLGPLLVTHLRQNNVLNRTEPRPIGDWNDILQDAKNEVPMYCSTPFPDETPMILTHIYEFVRNEQIDVENIPELALEKIFIPAHMTYIHKTRIPRNFLDADVPLRHWLPLLFSVNFWGGVLHSKEMDLPLNFEAKEFCSNTADFNPSNPLSAAARSEDFSSNTANDDPLFIASQLLPLIKKTRFDEENFWLMIGRVLCNISNGSDKGLALWIECSKEATVPGRDKASCTGSYRALKKNRLSVKTIAWFARLDNRSKYNEWHWEWSTFALRKALSKLDDDVSEALYRIFWLDYMFDAPNKLWYKFEDNRLKVDHDALSFKTSISRILIPIYENILQKLQESSIPSEGGEGSETAITLTDDMIKKLKRLNFQKTIVEYSRRYFSIEDFWKLRDADVNKTGWLNGVIECCNYGAYFREGFPEDFITMGTNIKYDTALTNDSLEVKELIEWFGKVFTDDDLLLYFLKDCASMLFGRNAEKIFRVWTGDGDNSKSMVVKLFQETFGDYCFNFPTEILCGNKNGGGSGPTPELAAAKGTHIAIIAEPDSGESIQAGKLKRYTGGDKFFARLCNENGGPVEAFFKMIFMCNVIPPVVNRDVATEKRYLILPFLSTWSMTAPESVVEQYKLKIFKMDPFFETRIPALAAAFAWVCVQYYPLYMEKGLKAPKIVKDCITKHLRESDPYTEFTRERIVVAYTDPEAKTQIDTNVTLTVGDVHLAFKNWCKDSFIALANIARMEFRKHMTMPVPGRLGPLNSKNGRWDGVRIHVPPIL